MSNQGDKMENATQARIITSYILKEISTGRVIQVYAPEKRKVARNRADRMDLQYGCINYSVIPVYAFATIPAPAPVAANWEI
jgi:hypothetical protein